MNDNEASQVGPQEVVEEGFEPRGPRRAVLIEFTDDGRFNIQPVGISPFELPTLLRKAAQLAEDHVLG